MKRNTTPGFLSVIACILLAIVCVESFVIMRELQKPEVGENLMFGAYEQDGNITNGKEPIEWLVLAKENNRLLVISRYALDSKPYSTKQTDGAWENCTLRNWLNNDFLHAAFSDKEQDRISLATIVDDSFFGVPTLDKVFLLSSSEVGKYFSSKSSRICRPTVYAQKQGAEPDNMGYCSWWLRTPGNDKNKAAYVFNWGDVIELGSDGFNPVRPAMWITLNP